MSGYLLADSAGEGASTGDKAQLDIVGDIEIVGVFALDNYPPSDAGNKWPLSKFAGGGERAYAFGWSGSANTSQVAWHDGTGTFFQNAPTDIHSQTSLPDGHHIWVKWTMDVDDGASGHVLTWWWSKDPIDTPEGDVTWTAWGSPQTLAGTTLIQNATSPLLVAQFDDDFSSNFMGKVYAGWVRDGIGGTLVANPDFRTDDQGWTSPPASDGLGNSYTLDNGATYVPPAGRHVGRHVHYDFANKQVVVESGV